MCIVFKVGKKEKLNFLLNIEIYNLNSIKIISTNNETVIQWLILIISLIK